MIKETTRRERQRQRHKRIRKKISGTAARPRVVVFKSNRYLYLQAVDDIQHQTLTSISSAKYKSEEAKSFKNKDTAARLGEEFAKVLKRKGIEAIVFDRNGYPYHGRVKAMADGLRKGGLLF